jgi:hypothetical protein
MMRKRLEEPRCSNGTRCVAYPALGEPSKLSRGNPGTRCFACEERRVASELERARANKKAADLRKKTEEPRWAETNGPREHPDRGHTVVDHAREVLERRRRSVLTCEGGLRSAVASGDERLVLRWSRALREAKQRLVWAEADLARAEKRAWSERAS